MNKKAKINRVMISATSSNAGKTTITCAILQALKVRGAKLATFKAGPDYIDPMFHTKILGSNSRNLDIFMTGENNVKYLLAKNSEGSTAVIEGVMGFYDGVAGTVKTSSYELSRATDTPVILVVNAKGKSLSVVAEINGFLNFMPNKIAGVILNNLPEKLYHDYKKMIEKNCDVKLLGHMPHIKDAEILSRHLGLIAPKTIDDLKKKIELLGQAAEKYINLDAILKIASKTSAIEYSEPTFKKIGACKIAIAKDDAFNFYYEDSIDLLKTLGAEIIYFSPLKDKKLSSDIDGMIIGGGYPELYLNKLSANIKLLAEIKNMAENSVPIIAECGGFLYLLEKLEGVKMVSFLKGNAEMTKQLNSFGYKILTAKADNFLLKKSSKIYAHEFHYSVASDVGNDFVSEKLSTKEKSDAVVIKKKTFAGYPHIHFYSNLELPKNFVKECIAFRNKRNGIS